MEKMLEVDGDKRINAAQTLTHPYLAEVRNSSLTTDDINRVILSFQYADPTDEPTAPFYDQTFEDYDLTVDVWKGGKQKFITLIALKTLQKKSGIP